jgi:DNA polymerase III alpha subunit
MNCLPRMRPRRLRLVVEVALIRPADPGRMVHPYLRRRAGASGRLSAQAKLIRATLGVPLFRSRACASRHAGSLQRRLKLRRAGAKRSRSA